MRKNAIIVGIAILIGLAVAQVIVQVVQSNQDVLMIKEREIVTVVATPIPEPVIHTVEQLTCTEWSILRPAPELGPLEFWIEGFVEECEDGVFSDIYKFPRETLQKQVEFLLEKVDRMRTDLLTNGILTQE